MGKWALITDFMLIAGMSLLGLMMILLWQGKYDFSKKILIAFFASAFFFLLYYYSYLHRLRTLGALSVFFGHGIGFLLGPLLLFQLKSLVIPKTELLKELYFQLIPFFLVWLLITLPLSISMATSYRGFVNWFAQNDFYFNISENIYFMIYIRKAYRYLEKLLTNVSKNYSTLEVNNLHWYKHLLFGLTGVVVIDTCSTIYELSFKQLPWNIGNLTAFSFVLLYSYLGYKGMIQSQILLPQFMINSFNETHKSQSNTSEVTKKSVGQLDNYSIEQLEQLKENLLTILREKKPYLNDVLTLTDLAKEVNISPKKLSELLNQHMNITFYNLINEYRVQEVIRRMHEPEFEKYSIEGLAYECGFYSKATFNRIFKLKTGKSPSTYKQEIVR